MGHKKQKHKHKRYDSVLGPLKQQRAVARKLGYENVEDYKKGLSTVKKLLANKGKDSKSVEKLPRPVKIIKRDAIS